MSQSIYGNHRSSYTIRTVAATRGPQTLTVESRSRDGGKSASNFTVNLSVPIQCESNQAIGYYLKEAHLPLGGWTVNTEYDSFQLAFPFAINTNGTRDTNIYTVKLTHGKYTGSEFAIMVEEAMNLAKHDGTAYVSHKFENSIDIEDHTNYDELKQAISTYNANRLETTTAIPVEPTGKDITTPVQFKVNYNTTTNRFSISRLDLGRFYQQGQFDIAIKHYQLAKAFGCPWGGTFGDKETWTANTASPHEPDYFTQPVVKKNHDDPEETYDARFYIPRSNGGYVGGTINDDSGAFFGDSRGKTFKNQHTHYILSSERWAEHIVDEEGINLMKNTSRVELTSAVPATTFEPITNASYMVTAENKRTPQISFYSQAMLMPFASRIRGDDCYYIRSSIFGGDNIQTFGNAGSSNCLQMVRIDKAMGEICFWNPTYTPEPHIITRRDIPSITFSITDKDHHLVDFNGEEVLLELEFITYDIVTIPLKTQEEGDRFSAPHEYAPDYARRAFSQPIRGGGRSHMPQGFANYR